MAWLRPEIIMSAISAIAAAIAAWISWFAYKHQKLQTSDLPTVGCIFKPIPDLPGWALATIDIRNPSEVAWQLTTIDLAPKSFKGQREDLMYGAYDSTTRKARFIPKVEPISWILSQNILMSSIRIDTEIPSTLDVNHGISRLRIFVYSASNRATKMSMHLNLCSMEAVQRRTAIAIKRNLPATSIQTNE